MVKIAGFLILCTLITGCFHGPGAKAVKSQIIKVTDFELSPDEDKIAFSAITPVGNSDIWVVNIDGTNLKKLTFKDRSPSNHIARFFKRRKWRNFFEIDMLYPKWTRDGRIAFCQRLTKHDVWRVHVVSERYWITNQTGTDRRPKTKKDEVLRRKPLNLIHSYELFDQSERHKKKIFLKGDVLWVLDFGENTPRKLIQY